LFSAFKFKSDGRRIEFRLLGARWIFQGPIPGTLTKFTKLNFQSRNPPSKIHSRASSPWQGKTHPLCQSFARPNPVARRHLNPTNALSSQAPQLPLVCASPQRQRRRMSAPSLGAAVRADSSALGWARPWRWYWWRMHPDPMMWWCGLFLPSSLLSTRQCRNQASVCACWVDLVPPKPGHSGSSRPPFLSLSWCGGTVGSSWGEHALCGLWISCLELNRFLGSQSNSIHNLSAAIVF
jgi:hypothetical protein